MKKENYVEKIVIEMKISNCLDSLKETIEEVFNYLYDSYTETYQDELINKLEDIQLLIERLERLIDLLEEENEKELSEFNK